ncbi:J domain-containing protein [Croceibacterium ferulae]|uniref:J domain-containing protein n=1 Tax=Croceibacterium ferulae TaxID=1854641 RepID=UPI000F85B856|nr:hypothetical protein [Croceibacterium ferulae]
MAGVGKGRVVRIVAALARVAMAAGIGCMVFSAAVTLILANGASPTLVELAADLGVQGAMWAVAGFVADRLLRVAGGRRSEPVAPAPPSWHNQHLGHERQARPVHRPAPLPTGWWTVLGVPADAVPASFESAARTLLRQSHPDRWATAEPARRQEAEGRTRVILQALAEARASSR